MITLAEWKLIGIILITTFFLSAMVLGIISEIATRMKNKTKKVAIKQITQKATKIDLCKNLMSNVQQEFIGQRQVIFNELVRM